MFCYFDIDIKTAFWGNMFQGFLKSTSADATGFEADEVVAAGARKVDIRLPGKGDSNSYGARPAY